MSPAQSLVWLITGSSSGLGTALTLYAAKAGHKVIATSRNPSKTPDLVKQVKDSGGIWLPLDVTAEPEQIKEVVEEGRNKFGKIDVLVNMAGYGILGAVEDISPKEAQAQMDTNFFGPLKVMQAVIPIMREQHSGSIVNISSAAGFDPRLTMGMYASSKWALEGLSQGIAKEIAPFGIRTYIIQPGAFTTNMQNALLFAEKTNPHYKDTDVGKILDFFSSTDPNIVHKSPNNADKGAKAIFEIVTGTGLAEGKEKQIKTAYVRAQISSDCAARSLDQIESLQQSYNVFKEVWESTKHDDGQLH
ncbi:hypothetical protein F5884DRAFT_666061 [Xylogone sp. PMI_703]|nr:hypothetical protein F5884DRAFT_666061 [Xylogone sp. PMI_703]